MSLECATPMLSVIMMLHLNAIRVAVTEAMKELDGLVVALVCELINYRLESPYCGMWTIKQNDEL